MTSLHGNRIIPISQRILPEEVSNGRIRTSVSLHSSSEYTEFRVHRTFAPRRVLRPPGGVVCMSSELQVHSSIELRCISRCTWRSYVDLSLWTSPGSVPFDQSVGAGGAAYAIRYLT